MPVKTKAQKDYSSKFLDPKWQKFRLEVFQRDDFKCRHCGHGESTLHAHHTYYEDFGTDPWNYELHTVITLCDGCHSAEHHYQKTVNKQLMDGINATGASWVDKTVIMTWFQLLGYKRLPNDYWKVMLMGFRDLDIYQKLKKLYEDDSDEITGILKGLSEDNYELLIYEDNE